MKTLLLTIALASPVAAQEVTPVELCSKVHELASTIMKHRQNEVSMVKMVELAGQNAVALILVKSAYDVPSYRAESNKSAEVKRFANGAFKERLSAFDGDAV